MRKLAAFLIAVLVLLLVACGNSESQTEDVSVDDSVEQQITETDPVQVQSSECVVYYYFIESDSCDIPAGSAIILPDILILAPTQSDIPCVTDPAVNISSALQAMIEDPRNEWTSDDLAIIDVAFNGGHADVVLQGEITGAGDIVLIASGMQILMTVFADATVNTATVTLNGECIGNLGTSHESEARPADYAYTRADIEAFITDESKTQ